ncbi:thiazole biosynthesis protein ThiF [Desulfosarcina widdelii]|uniref:Thiazole biosynthesis protein ThiF n=1 Tax=Desulfosarcina widdelii TaxID=947919 RepID=A0A5K7ZHC3_9BACT|nr:HesA/MoeB/ThiF family protein [Desulfosarcina widdelii]BBO79221.1 thiazole biosynthesis protein ThiF [Desulfosarcina widdelii]
MQNTIDSRLKLLARDGTLADGTPCRVISDNDTMRLAREMGVSGWQVEVRALERKILPDRYLRNRKSLSMEDQIRLLKAHVCIVGLGGLGGLVTESLARMGVGRLKLVDGDVFETHNLNRQLLCTTDAVGTSKADAAARRVAAIHPGIEVTVGGGNLTPSNALEILRGCDLAVDCLDNIPSRFALAATATETAVPLVSAAVAGLSGHITTFFPDGPGLESIYGPEDPHRAFKGDEIRQGCLAPAVNLMASLECVEVLNVLLDRPGTLKNRLLVVDLNDYTFETVALS